jgi:parallel beta-helix repeat protein
MAPAGTKKLEISYTEKNVPSTPSQVTKTVTINIKVKVPEVPIVNGVRTANILDFGADPSDVLTDKAAIQDALDVSTADGVPLVVYIPAGTYYIGNTLYIHSNTTIHMEPGATIIRNSHLVAGDSREGVDHNMLRAANSGTDTDVVGGYDNVKNIVIEGGVWDGGDISQSTITANVINIGHAENVTIRNTTIKNSYGAHLIEFAGVKNSEIYGCYFTGFRKETNGVDCEAIQLDVCYSDWNGAYKADKTVCDNVSIHDNQFESYPVAAGNHHVLSGYHNKNITITNNILNNPNGGYQGIYLYGFDNTTVSNNTISGYENGIKTNQAVNYTLTQNTISNCDFGIVSAGSSTGKITSNNISNTNYQGIFAYDATKITSISKNILTKVGTKTSAPRDGIAACGYGVQIDEIKGNTIDTTLRYGIYIYSGALATKINSNTISNTKKSGIYVYEAKAKATIKSNKLTKVGTNAIKIASSTYVKQNYTFAPKVKKLNLKKGTLSITATNLTKVQLNFKKKSYSKSTTKKKYTLKFKAYKKSVKTANVLFTDKKKNVVTRVVTVK